MQYLMKELLILTKNHSIHAVALELFKCIGVNHIET